MEGPALWCYNETILKQHNTVDYSIPIQLKLPVDLQKIIKINDPVYSFSEVMAHIDLQKYFVEKGDETGRPRYDREKLLKIVLFAFMEFGYCSVRFIHKLCETDIGFMRLLDEEEAPSHMTISNFIKQELRSSLDEIFDDINAYMFDRLDVDLDHAYIDGTKLEANANKYTWVWKKNCINSRNKVFGKLSALLEEVNEVMALYKGAVFELRQEYQVSPPGEMPQEQRRPDRSDRPGAYRIPQPDAGESEQHPRSASANGPKHPGRGHLWRDQVE